MAKPKVFISSTCFDLMEIRDSLCSFIKGMGFDPVLSEHGDVFYHPDLHTHDACLHEVLNCQLFVLIIGGRFGGTYVNDKSKSITNAEYEAARECNLPIFTYVKRGVLDNHHSYQANRDKPFIKDFHFTAIEKQGHALDIFEFIDVVRKAKSNNAFEGFETSSDIEEHLRKQFAGMFFDFLKNREVREQMSAAQTVLSALKTSSEKLEDLVKGLYGADDKESSAKLVEKLDSKYAAIQFIKDVLDDHAYGEERYICRAEDVAELAKIDPKKLEWHEYLVELGCYKEGKFIDDETGEVEPTIDFYGLDEVSEGGYVLGDDLYHKEKRWFYKNGIQHLDVNDRKSVLERFARFD